MRCIVAASLLLVGLTATAGEDVVIHAGEQAVIRFQFDEPPVTDDGQPVNFLVLDIGGSYVDFLGDSVLEQVLIDGNQQLAVRQSFRHDGMRARFIAEDVPWNGVVTDFGAINSGTIEGVLIVRAINDGRSSQSRVRFGGNLVTGRAVAGEAVQPGPSARITGCYIEAPVFSDRFDGQLRHPPGSLAHRECQFGSPG